MYSSKNYKEKVETNPFKVNPNRTYCTCKKSSKNISLGQGYYFCNKCRKWIKDS